MHNLKTIFIAVNTSSGGGLGREILKRYRAESAELSTKFYFCDLLNENIQKLREQIINSDAFVIAGGDGTVSHVVNDLKNISTPILIVPLGTGNDLGREFKIPYKIAKLSLSELVDFISTSDVNKLQTWNFRCETKNIEKLFCNYLSFGFDGAVIKTFDEVRKKPNYFLSRFGKWGNRITYGGVAIYHLFLRPGPVKVRFNNDPAGSISVISLLFSNIQSIAGLGRSNSLSNPSDQKLEALLIKGITKYLSFTSNLFVPYCFPEILNSSNEWGFTLENPVPGQIDGEPFMQLLEGACKITPGPLLNLFNSPHSSAGNS